MISNTTVQYAPKFQDNIYAMRSQVPHFTVDHESLSRNKNKTINNTNRNQAKFYKPIVTTETRPKIANNNS